MLSTITTFLDQLEPVDIIRASALILFFFTVLFVNRRRDVWFQGETAALTLGGLMWIFLPNVLLEIQTTAKVDIFHKHIGRILGGGLLSLAVCHGKVDKGENVNLSRIIAGFAASSSMFVAGLYGYFKYAAEKHHFTVQFFTLGLLAVTLWCIGSMVMTYRACSNGSYGYNNFRDSNRRLVIHQLIDLLSLGLLYARYAGLNINFTEIMVQQDFKPDGIHLTMLRVLGGVIVYIFLMAVSTLIFQSEDQSVNGEQAKANFVSRLVFIGLTLAIIIFNQYSHGLFKTEQLYPALVMCVMLAINCLMGIRAAEEDIY